MGVELRLLAAMRLGQRIIVGTRMPPSYKLCFMPRSGKFDVTEPFPPLSEVQTTIVFSLSFSWSSLRSSRPTFSSMCSTIPA